MGGEVTFYYYSSEHDTVVTSMSDLQIVQDDRRRRQGGAYLPPLAAGESDKMVDWLYCQLSELRPLSAMEVVALAARGEA